MSTPELTGSITVNAPPTAVSAAIAGPQGMSVWLADEARSDKRPDGRVVLWWNDGRQAVGRWAEHVSPERFVLRARFDDRPGWARLVFSLREGDGGTVVDAHATADTQDDLEPWSVIWQHALADIKTFAETGKNGRYLRRPMLGVNLQEVDDAMAESKGLPVRSGILITAVVADGGAAKGGILKDDVIVAIADRQLSGWASIGAALDHYVVGDAVPVRLWRDGEERILEVTLGGREEPAAPTEPDAIRDALAANYARMARRLEELVGGVSEEQADYRPAEGEWTIKQVLAHLSDSERWFTDDVVRLAADEPALGWAPHTSEIRERCLGNMPLAHLLQRLVLDLRDAAAQATMLLAESPQPPLLSQLGQASTWSPEHFDEHMAQIEANVAASSAAENS